MSLSRDWARTSKGKESHAVHPWEELPLNILKPSRVGVVHGSMKLVAQIKLTPSPEQASALLRTMERVNKACDWISSYAFEHKVYKRFPLQKAVYHDVKGRFGLTAQAAIHATRKVADAYTTTREQIASHNAKCKPHKRRELEQITFRPHGSITYDDRILAYYTDRQEVSIWTVDGRERIGFVVGEHHARLLAFRQGESDLVYRKQTGEFFLVAVCDIPEDKEIEVEGVLGVDLGIVEIATTSEGESFSGEQIEEKRKWYAERKAVLQSIGTRSAKRRLRQLSGRESRFRKDVNHQISKRIVERAKVTDCAIALEDLTSIRKRTTVRRSQRAKHHSWAFYQLRSFIEYKAQRAGIPVVLVDPAYTSRTCSVCGHCEKKNRKSQSRFECEACGYTANADYNAAKNIAAGGHVSGPMVAPDDVEAVLHSQGAEVRRRVVTSQRALAVGS